VTIDSPGGIPNSLHADLVAGKVAFPQFASTKQPVLEVFFSRAPGRPVLIDARGTLYTFTSDGKLDPSAFAEAAVSALEGSRSRRIQDHVIDITPTVRSRRWTSNQTWQPSSRMLRVVRADLRTPSKAAVEPRLWYSRVVMRLIQVAVRNKAVPRAIINVFNGVFETS
jgi:hypothetical protein